MLPIITPAVLPDAFYARNAVAVAPDLLGATLTVRGVSGRIVETEAYCHDDPASHSFRGPTPRNAAMFGPAGRAYVYRSYGIHWCLNVVCTPGDAVLVRALEPLTGLDIMAQRRGAAALCTGPGRIGQALMIGPDDNGQPFDRADFAIIAGAAVPAGDILAGPRIGISRATGLAWRFGLRGSSCLSRRFAAP